MKHSAPIGRLLSAGVLAAAAFAALAPDAHARERDDGAPADPVLGLGIGEWSGIWWQHVLAIPASSSPFGDSTGALCQQGQVTIGSASLPAGQAVGPVFYLAGAASGSATRTCTVKASQTLLVPIINGECSNVEQPPFYGADAQAMRVCAAALLDGVDLASLRVELDGRPLRNLQAARAQSPLVDFTMPASDNFLGLPGVTRGSLVSDGYWVFVGPLRPGHHVLRFGAKVISGPAAGYSQDLTYRLIVER